MANPLNNWFNSLSDRTVTILLIILAIILFVAAVLPTVLHAANITKKERKLRQQKRLNAI